MDLDEEFNFNIEKTRQVCEIYINGRRKKADIGKRISEFLKICDLLLRCSDCTFHVYCQRCNEGLFGEILKLYRECHPGTILFMKGQKTPSSKKPDYTIIFNWEEEIVGYDKEFYRIKFSSDNKDRFINNNEQIDFTKVDLMDWY